MLAGLVSIVGGVYSIKTTFFQQAALGQLSGAVRDVQLARPLRLATVEILDPEGDVISTLSTDDEGIYLIRDLKEGSYRLKASAPRHASEERKVRIEKNRRASVDFNLTPLADPEPNFSNLPPIPVIQAPPPQPLPVYSEPPRDPYAQNAYEEGTYARRDQDPYGEGYRDPYTGLPRKREPKNQQQALFEAGALLVKQMLEKKSGSGQETKT